MTAVPPRSAFLAGSTHPVGGTGLAGSTHPAGGTGLAGSTHPAGGARIVDVAVAGPGARDLLVALDGAPGCRSVAWLQRLPPPGVAGVVVACDPPALDGYARAQPVVVVFAGRPDDHEALAALRAGVVSVLVRGEFTRAELVAAVAGARRGRSWLTPSAATAAARALRNPPPARPAPARLAARDLALLDALASGAPNAQVARVLGVAVQTVRNRSSAVYAKIGVRTRADAVTWWLNRTLRGLTDEQSTSYREPRPGGAGVTGSNHPGGGR